MQRAFEFRQDAVNLASDEYSWRDWQRQFRDQPEWVQEVINLAREEGRCLGEELAQKIFPATIDLFPMDEYLDILKKVILFHEFTIDEARLYARRFREYFQIAYYGRPGGKILTAYERAWCRNGSLGYKDENGRAQCECDVCGTYKSANIYYGRITLGWVVPSADGRKYTAFINVPAWDEFGNPFDCEDLGRSSDMRVWGKALRAHKISVMHSFAQAWLDLLGALYAHWGLKPEDFTNNTVVPIPQRNRVTRQTNQPDLARINRDPKTRKVKCHVCGSWDTIGFYKESPGFHPHDGPYREVKNANKEVVGVTQGKPGDKDNFAYLCEDCLRHSMFWFKQYWKFQFWAETPSWFIALTQPQRYVTEGVKADRAHKNK